MSDRRSKSNNTLEGPVTEVAIEMPQRSVLVKCPGCHKAIKQRDLEDNLDVCPRCGHHLRLGGRKRLAMTVDTGSFEEWDADLAAQDFLEFPGYTDKLKEHRSRTSEPDALICGRATIMGNPCAIFVMNGDFMMGSMGSVVGEKVCHTFEKADELGLPVVGITVSGGARMQEGTTSLMQMAKVSAAVGRHAQKGLPYFVLLTDPTSGGVTASFAMEADIALAEPGALVAFAGPRVVEQTTHKRLPAGFQRAEFQLEHGFVDMIVPRGEIRPALGELLALHAGVCPGTSAPHAIVPLGRKRLLHKWLQGRKEVDHGDGTPYGMVRAARSTSRPSACELIERACDGFVELHGDRLFGDDPAIVGGIAWIGDRAFTVICTERGRSTRERVERNFGSPNPEGYRKALRLMREAERFGRPVVCLIDTSGAYCGMGAEERGQGAAIADNLVAMSGLKVPVVSTVVGEGGSGGALALAVADRVLMLSNAVYSVVSPEGCASILWKTADRADEAAQALHLTASDLVDLGIVDGFVSEDGLDADGIARALFGRITSELDALSGLSVDELTQARYDKFRSMGRFA